jgi:hypothetical protein
MNCPRSLFILLITFFSHPLGVQAADVRFVDDSKALQVLSDDKTLPRTELAGVNYQPTEGNRHISYYTSGRMAKLLAPLLPPDNPVLKKLGLSLTPRTKTRRDSHATNRCKVYPTLLFPAAGLGGYGGRDRHFERSLRSLRAARRPLPLGRTLGSPWLAHADRRHAGAAPSGARKRKSVGHELLALAGTALSQYRKRK